MKKRLVCLLLCITMVFTSTNVVQATRSEIQNNISEAEQELDEAQDRINDLSAQQAVIAAQIDDANADLVDLMVQIDAAEQSIAATEAQIEETEAQIVITTEELAVAEANKQEQYDYMKKRIRYIYENGGDAAWFKMILEVNDIATMLNRAEYVQSLHDADRKMLAEFAAVVQQVAELKASLESQKAALEEEKASLEAQKAALQVQESELQIRLSQMEAENANFQSLFAEARSQAQSISALIAEQQAELERIEAAERAAAEEAARRQAAEEEARRQQAASSNNSSSNNSSSSNSSGSGASSVPSYSGNGSGSSIVAYADQFVGNPYVWGGNSLTNGIDCSHFVYQVLKNCGVYSGGYETSAGWRSLGSPVSSLSEAQAGDVICYSGHVAIYDGYGGIVEAKGSKWGITHDRSATCNTILAIRRFT